MEQKDVEMLKRGAIGLPLAATLLFTVETARGAIWEEGIMALLEMVESDQGKSTRQEATRISSQALEAIVAAGLESDGAGYVTGLSGADISVDSRSEEVTITFAEVSPPPMTLDGPNTAVYRASIVLDNQEIVEIMNGDMTLETVSEVAWGSSICHDGRCSDTSETTLSDRFMTGYDWQRDESATPARTPTTHKIWTTLLAQD